jgi:hypothetical protein
MRSILRNQALLVFLAAILLLTSCGSSNSIEIHNPLTGELKVTIDDKEYVLPARATRQLKLSKGSHKVKSTLDGKVLIDSTLEILSDHKSAGCMINVSGESMYLWTEMYGTSMQNISNQVYANDPRLDSLNAARYEQAVGKTNVLMIDSTVIIGPIVEYPATQLVIKKTWRFGIDTPFPQQIEESGSGGGIAGKGIAKLFTKDDMRAYWASEYGSMMKED